MIPRTCIPAISARPDQSETPTGSPRCDGKQKTAVKAIGAESFLQLYEAELRNECKTVMVLRDCQTHTLPVDTV